MANNSKNINSIFDDIANDAQNVAIAAVKDASKRVQKDIYRFAIQSGLQHYYNSYTPSVYRRTKKLKKAIRPYYADNSNSDGISIEVGVKYDSDALIGKYESTSWYHQDGDDWMSRSDDDFDFSKNNNGRPEPSWILNNFWEGIHPRFNPRRGYKDVSKKTTPQSKLLDEFYNKVLYKRIGKYIQSAIENEIYDRFK